MTVLYYRFWLCVGIALGTFGLPGCLNGTVTDRSHQTISNARITIRNCNDCLPNSTVTGRTAFVSNEARYQLGTYANPRIAEQTGNAEAVEITVERAGFRTLTFFHTVEYLPIMGIVNPWIAEATKNIVLYPDSSPDSDSDGLSDLQEADIGTHPHNPDTDGDGLPDGWEVNGHNFVDLHALGADPLRKDVFVEIDYMADENAQINLQPNKEAVQLAIDAFAKLPVVNPDGTKGIRLHINISDAIRLDTNLSPVWDKVDSIKNASFSPHRRKIFHYCVIGVRHSGSTSSGRTQEGDVSDIVITLGPDGTSQTKAVAETLIHELMSQLGLPHKAS